MMDNIPNLRLKVLIDYVLTKRNVCTRPDLPALSVSDLSDDESDDVDEDGDSDDEWFPLGNPGVGVAVRAGLQASGGGREGGEGNVHTVGDVHQQPEGGAEGDVHQQSEGGAGGEGNVHAVGDVHQQPALCTLLGRPTLIRNPSIVICVTRALPENGG